MRHRLDPDNSASLAAAVDEAVKQGYGAPEGVDFAIGHASDGLLRLACVGPDYDVLVEAAERNRAARLQQEIGRLTWYFICTRPRIRATAAQKSENGELTIEWTVATKREPLVWRQPCPEWLDHLEIDRGGRRLVAVHRSGQRLENSAALMAQQFCAPRPYSPSVFDLKVEYIGRARGEVARTCALDRLETHEKYQRVLEEVSDDEIPRDIWMVLASGTTMHLLTGHSKLKDPEEYLKQGDDRARDRLTEANRVDLVEALLINYFKPRLNVQHVNRLGLNHKVLLNCRRARITGVALAYGTHGLGVALYTDSIPARLQHGMTVSLV